MMTAKHRRLLAAMAAIITAGLVAGTADIASAQKKRPNILVIMGDDIGTWNLSYMNRGMMGYRLRFYHKFLGSFFNLLRCWCGC